MGEEFYERKRVNYIQGMHSNIGKGQKEKQELSEKHPETSTILRSQEKA